MVEQWDSEVEHCYSHGRTVMVEQCGGTVERSWWNSVVEQYGGTVEQ